MSELYYSGKPCRKGHGTRRYVNCRKCVMCQAILTENYRRANMERHAVLEAARRKANPERHRAIKRACYVRHAEKNRRARSLWGAANPEKVLLQQRKQRKQNPASSLASNARRHARKMHAPGRGVSAEQWRQVLADSLGLCAYCNERKPLTMDHIEPLSKGGAHDIENLAPCCLQCNSAKFNTPLLLWLVRRARTRAMENAA